MPSESGQNDAELEPSGAKPEPIENPENDAWKEKQIPLKDIVLSNSWAMQAILQYLEETQPGARDRIWAHYEAMRSMADATQRQPPDQDGDEPDMDPNSN